MRQILQQIAKYQRSLVRRRGFDLVECGASSADFGYDLLRWLLPDEGLRVVVPVFGPQLDRFGKLYDRIGHPAAETALGDLCEPTLDEVAPRRGCRGEVQVPAGPLGISEPIPCW